MEPDPETDPGCAVLLLLALVGAAIGLGLLLQPFYPR